MTVGGSSAGTRRAPRRRASRALSALMVAALGAVAVASCGAEPDAAPTDPATGPATPSATPAGPTPGVTVQVAPPSLTAPPSPSPSPEPTRPDWLGTRVLEERPDGFGYAQKTPKELRERALPPRPFLPEPLTDEFASSIEPVPDHVLKRSTYKKGCPVHKSDLRYLKMTFWGFDDKPHTGEMIVHKDVAEDVVSVFKRLYNKRYPIEEMRVYSKEDRRAPRTGDLNVTSAYACRPVATTANVWSQHAYGLAIDINPFQNPYTKDDLIVPELSRSYLDRDWRRPGMIYDDDVVVRAFASIGWEWGGLWSRPVDLHHFSLHNK